MVYHWKLAGLGLLVALAASCGEDTVSAPGDTPAPVVVDTATSSSLVPAGSVRAAIVQEQVTPDGVITFLVRVESNGVAVSAFQGAVTFAPGTFQLVEVSTPIGASNEGRVLNTSTFLDGRIRFAGYAANTLTVDQQGRVEAFRFTVRPLQSSAASQLSATLDVVGTPVGSEVAASRVLPSAGIRDINGALVK